MRQQTNIEQLQIAAEGIVQGVGFRPAVYRIATQMGLVGSVQNQGRCVQIILEGERAKLSGFVAALRAGLPAQARIDTVRECWRAATLSYSEFCIIDSELTGDIDLAIPADLATCPDCWREFQDPAGRRHLYPFTTCVACGPRYTVIEAMPYDRCRTTLAEFPLCDACRAEYENPLDRRFHAESTACPDCGPQVALFDASFTPLYLEPREVFRTARAALASGSIVAVRGLGGYLLCCDAANREAVARLRQRKRRPHQPFAVMARSTELVQRDFMLGEDEKRWLQSPVGPILILPMRVNAPLDLDLIAPDTRDVGVMIPTTPLHWLLFHDACATRPCFEYLIMTSGNAHGEPICRDDSEALARLGGLFDLALSHNRGIARVCDDSLFHAAAGGVRVLRRARGIAPDKIDLAAPLASTVLAMGGDLKNTLALGYDRKAILSPHVGDLNYLATHKAYRRLTTELVAFFARPPSRVAVDLHPDYISTAWGRDFAAQRGLDVVTVQHHHAHAVSCLAEHGRMEGLALVFDGSGYGTDGTIWGGEFFQVNGDGTFLRLGALRPTPLVGGEASILHPTRLAITRLAGLGVAAHDSLYERLGFSPREVKLCHSARAMDQGAVMTSSAGRLFDVVAALLGLAPAKITYEGQAAIRLETLAREALAASGRSLVQLVADEPHYAFDLTEEDGLTRWAGSDSLLGAVLRDLLDQVPRGLIALRFHVSLARLAQTFARDGMMQTGYHTVAVSGGVMQNRLLVELLFLALGEAGCEVLAHTRVPANDGGISLGQVVVAGMARPEVSPQH